MHTDAYCCICVLWFAARKHVHIEVSIDARRIVGMWTMMRLNLEAQFKVCVLFSRAQSRTVITYDWSIEQSLLWLRFKSLNQLDEILVHDVCIHITVSVSVLRSGAGPLSRASTAPSHCCWWCPGASLVLPRFCKFCEIVRLLKLQVCVPDCGQGEGRINSETKYQKNCWRCMSFL